MLKLLMPELSEHTKFKKMKILDANTVHKVDFGHIESLALQILYVKSFTPVNMGVSKGNIINTQSSERTLTAL